MPPSIVVLNRRSSSDDALVESDGQRVLADLQGRALREFDRVASWDSPVGTKVLAFVVVDTLHGATRAQLFELKVNVGRSDAEFEEAW